MAISCTFISIRLRCIRVLLRVGALEITIGKFKEEGEIWKQDKKGGGRVGGAWWWLCWGGGGRDKCGAHSFLHLKPAVLHVKNVDATLK